MLTVSYKESFLISKHQHWNAKNVMKIIMHIKHSKDEHNDEIRIARMLLQ